MKCKQCVHNKSKHSLISNQVPNQSICLKEWTRNLIKDMSIGTRVEYICQEFMEDTDFIKENEMYIR